MKFCKHDYSLVFYEQTPNIKDWEYTDRGIKIETQAKVGCAVICKKCGKQKKRLARKISKMYANNLIDTERYKKGVKTQLYTLQNELWDD